MDRKLNLHRQILVDTYSPDETDIMNENEEKSWLFTVYQLQLHSNICI